MQATGLRLTGDFSIDALSFDHTDVSDPGPYEVLVRVRAVSLNYRDLMVVAGHYNPNIDKPRTIGSDCAGEVVAVGPGVKQFHVGDRVVAGFMPDWVDGPASETGGASALGNEQDGVLTTFRKFPEHGLVHLPERFTFAEGATFPCAGVTAWHALITTGHVGPEDTVLVLGTGGVSIFGLQVAKLHRATVIVTSSSDEKLERARKLGADETINYKAHPEWDKEVRRITQQKGATHVLEVGGAGTLPLSLRAAGLNSQISVIGVLSGVEQPLNIIPVLRNNLRVQGIYVGSIAMLRNLIGAFDGANIHPIVDRVFPFEESRQALRHMQSGTHFGKLVITLP